MNKMNFSEVSNIVNNYAANHAATQMGHNIVCVVTLKERAVRAAGRHIIGHAAKAYVVHHCTFPQYTSKVASVLGMSITPQPLNGMVWENYPYIKKAIKSGYRYLNIYYGLSDVRMETHTKWLWDGREATAAEIAEIERYLVPSKGGAVRAAMYQIDAVNEWDGFYYFGEDKAKAKEIWEQIGVLK